MNKQWEEHAFAVGTVLKKLVGGSFWNTLSRVLRLEHGTCTWRIGDGYTADE